MLHRILLVMTITVAVVTVSIAARAEPESGHSHNHEMSSQDQVGMVMKDSRILVHYPDMLRIHTLSSMRDHLLAVSEIQAALADNEFDKASQIAEQRLGMTSLKLHGAHEVAKYMPEEMRKMGTAMHRSASRFAVAATNAAVNGDVKPALSALSQVTQSCVACHSSFRLH